MVKRSTKKKVEIQTKRKGSSVADRLKIPVSQEQPSLRIGDVLEEYRAQQPVFESPEEAVAWWIEKIAERIEGNSKGRAEMQEFLKMLVETDPVLQEQLLQEIKLNK